MAKLKSIQNRKKKVLIVEDNEFNMKLFVDLFKMKYTLDFVGVDSIDIVTNTTGINVYKLVKKEKPDLILMDIQLGGISGFDITKVIKADESIKHIPIIIVTAFAMKEDKQKILLSGCNYYLSKPFAIDSLLSKAKELLL